MNTSFIQWLGDNQASRQAASPMSSQAQNFISPFAGPMKTPQYNGNMSWNNPFVPLPAGAESAGGMGAPGGQSISGFNPFMALLGGNNPMASAGNPFMARMTNPMLAGATNTQGTDFLNMLLGLMFPKKGAR